jgi:hypothetical protein
MLVLLSGCRRKTSKDELLNTIPPLLTRAQITFRIDHDGLQPVPWACVLSPRLLKKT